MVGAVSRWYVDEGDVVREGDMIANIETEKVSTELRSPVAGRIRRLLTKLHEDVAVGSVILFIEPM
jgi:pyruvate/2-oxoglutarate dehydrogenase complex dihydrolipoamide acyltransferase (E2) component